MEERKRTEQGVLAAVESTERKQTEQDVLAAAESTERKRTGSPAEEAHSPCHAPQKLRRQSKRPGREGGGGILKTPPLKTKGKENCQVQRTCRMAEGTSHSTSETQVTTDSEGGSTEDPFKSSKG